MASDLLLPLFPLEVVLLPGGTLPLHIFEERYKLMIGEAIEQHSEFGMVLAHGNSVANLGCSAVVEKVVKRYEDGRLDILTAGRRRFEILFLDDQKAYLQAAVHFIADDETAAAPAPEVIARLRELCVRVAEYVPSMEAVAGEEEVLDSFQIADAVPSDLDFKQRLLGQRSEAERMATLNEYLEKLVPRLATTRKAEAVSRGNGHAR
jgi:Lon protease-like protein